MNCQSSHQLPMALAANGLSASTPRFLHITSTTSSTSLPSILIPKVKWVESFSTRTYQDGSEVIIPRSGGSSWRDEPILVCNPTFDASSRARARAHAASSSSKYARPHQRRTRVWTYRSQWTSVPTKRTDSKRRSAINATAACTTRT